MKRILQFIFFFAALNGSIFASDFSDPYVQWVPSNAKNTAAFIKIRNTSGSDKKIIKAESNICRTVELHEHIMEGGVMQMRPVPFVKIPAGKELAFNPAGYHIMIMDLKKALNEGENVSITLYFEDGEVYTMNFAVKRDASPAMDHSAHGSHGSHGSHGGHQGHHMAADMIPPAGVMGAHMHSTGSWVFDYRIMAMEMDKLMELDHEVYPLQVLAGIYRKPSVQMSMTGLAAPSPYLPPARIEQNEYRYMSVGMEMTMEMRMFSPMYQYSENTMLMLMIPYNVYRMTMIANNFETAEMSSKGLGDISLSGTFRIWTNGNHSLFTGTGLSLPTGSIDEKDWMPQMGKYPVGYAMQPGVGTFAFLGQAAYTGKNDSLSLSWGLQLDGTARMGKNANNYRAGNRYSGTLWTAYRFADWVSASLRLQNQLWENYKGQDPSLDPTMDPGNDPELQGGHRMDLFLGMNFMVTKGKTAGLMFFAEAGRPVRQHLNGPQMATTFIANFGVQYSL